MHYYPVNLNIAKKRCAVIGGGKIAERKTEAILEAGGQVHIISPSLTKRLSELTAQGAITCQLRPYKPGDIENFFLVVCAAADPEVNSLAAVEAKEQGALVNVVDNEQLSDFIVPAKIRRDSLVITVSTSGKSPALAKLLKEDLASRYGTDYGELLEFIGQMRRELKETLPECKERESFWHNRLDANILSLLREGRIEEAKTILRNNNTLGE